jgi:hypothetical protein
MSKIQTQPGRFHLFASVVGSTMRNITKPQTLLHFSKSLLKFPLQYSAGRTMAEVPAATFRELFSDSEELQLRVDPEMLSRHLWNVKLHEEVYLSAAVQSLQPMRIFEFGTWNGNTTRQLAESAPDDAKVFTLDLPDSAFEASQSAEPSTRIGERYKDSPARLKIEQIRANSLSFDFSPYFSSIDFVFVDAGHDYRCVLNDTEIALKMVRPGGAIFWHDFEPINVGLIHAVREATAGLPLRRLDGTTFAVLRIPPANSPRPQPNAMAAGVA